jgi:DNA-directed RNA polymerase specialized sigma24 family protein
MGTAVSSITAAGLARLLERLHTNRDRAGEEYERLRRALVRFFDWRGALAPDECADVAIDRLAARLEADTAIVDVRQYARGVARLVLLERQRQPPLSSLDADPPPTVVAPYPAAPDRAANCLDRCLGGLSADNRAMVLSYYNGEGGAKIAGRRRLAASLGISESALRNRMQRLRDQLERCITVCIGTLRDGRA